MKMLLPVLAVVALWNLEGQDAAAAASGNAPISDALREQVNAAIDTIVTE